MICDFVTEHNKLIIVVDCWHREVPQLRSGCEGKKVEVRRDEVNWDQCPAGVTKDESCCFISKFWLMNVMADFMSPIRIKHLYHPDTLIVLNYLSLN